MLGLPDVCHAFVLFQRSRQRCRSRGTDVVAVETTRVAMNTNRKIQGLVLDQKEDATQVCAAGCGCAGWLT